MGVRFDTEEKVVVKIPAAITRVGEGKDMWGHQNTYEETSSIELVPHEDNVGEVTVCLYHPDIDNPHIRFSCKIKRLMLALRMLGNLGE